MESFFLCLTTQRLVPFFSPFSTFFLHVSHYTACFGEELVQRPDDCCSMGVEDSLVCSGCGWDWKEGREEGVDC